MPNDAEALACKVSDRRSPRLPASLTGAWGPDWRGSGDLYAAVQSRGYTGDRLPDGRIDFKLGFWRGRTGQLQLTATQVGGGGRAGFDVMESAYEVPGPLPVGIRFSEAGCWRITGRLGADSVVVTVLIR
jgi:hypothetical protein